VTGVPATEWIRGLPKAEIHVHLEGCLSPAVLAAAAGRAGLPAGSTVPPPFADLTALLEALDRSCALIDAADLVERVAYDAAARIGASGTRYADMIFNPSHWPAWVSRLDDFVAALDRGFSAAELDGYPPVALCVSIGRDQSAADATALAEWAASVESTRLVGLSVDGNEASSGRTGPRFAEAFRYAAAHGLRRAVHAGESSGPEGVRDACDVLGAERIDHGIRAIEDPELVIELAARGMPLAICPTSNLALGLVGDMGEHPIEPLRRAGVVVTLNTDDPMLFGCDLVSEYERCAEAFGWGHETLIDLARASISSSFAPGGFKEQLFTELDTYRTSTTPE